MADGRAARVVPALGAGQDGCLVLQDDVEDPEAGAHGEGEQALFQLVGELGDGERYGLGRLNLASCPASSGASLAFFGVTRPVLWARRPLVW